MASLKRRSFNLFVSACAFSILFAGLAIAQENTPPPSFWDPARRAIRPETPKPFAIRFLTEGDYPPFHFVLSDGALVGFDVELARALCEELNAECSIQIRPWEELTPALQRGDGDAIIASLAIDGQHQAKVAFTTPYYMTPGRFLVRQNNGLTLEPTPETMEGKLIGVVGASAHEAYLQRYFPRSRRQSFATAEAARAALAAGDVEALFADAISSAVWLAGASSASCCAFLGGPFISSRYFGTGVGIAVAQNNEVLRHALNFALAALAAQGRYGEIFLKYFPVNPF